MKSPRRLLRGIKPPNSTGGQSRAGRGKPKRNVNSDPSCHQGGGQRPGSRPGAFLCPRKVEIFSSCCCQYHIALSGYDLSCTEAPPVVRHGGHGEGLHVTTTLADYARFAWYRGPR